MRYIILDLFGGPEYASIVTDTDGNNLVFHELTEAEAEAADCQDPDDHQGRLKAVYSLKTSNTPLSKATSRRFLRGLKCVISDLKAKY